MIICSCANIRESDLKERIQKHQDMFGFVDLNDNAEMKRLADAIWEDLTMDVSICNSCLQNDDFFFKQVTHCVFALQEETPELISQPA